LQRYGAWKRRQNAYRNSHQEEDYTWEF
jgi:hypothetical protein